MMQCATHPDLQPFYDGQLDGERREGVQQHVEHCDECSRELSQLRSLSTLLAIPESDEMTDAELARLHRALDETIEKAEPLTLRFPWVKALAAAAASVLIIGMAWMSQGQKPGGPMGPGTGPGIASAQNDWMRVAVTLQVDPPPPGFGEPGLADAKTANWFLENLDGSTDHANN